MVRERRGRVTRISSSSDCEDKAASYIRTVSLEDTYGQQFSEMSPDDGSTTEPYSDDGTWGVTEAGACLTAADMELGSNYTPIHKETTNSTNKQNVSL